MDVPFDPGQRDLVIGALAAMAAFCSVVVVSWPYVAGSTLETRMRRVAGEREKLRKRERERLNATSPVLSLRRRPKKLFTTIVDWLRLEASANDGRLSRTLQTAGYRGRSALISYLAVRIIAPVVLSAVTLFYVFLVMQLAQPPMVKLLIAAAAGGVGYFLPDVYIKNRITKRQQAIQAAWPDALDLLLICVESGMGIESALLKVSEEIGVQSVELAEELSLTTAELSFLPDRQLAYDNLSARTGLDTVKSVMASIKQAEKHGTSLGKSLRVLAQENRDMRLRLAEKKAAALPPMLTVPMIMFFLPVLFVVILTPAIIQIMEM